MNIKFEYLNEKRSTIRAKHISEGGEGVIYRKCKWWNKTAVKNSIIFYYFKKLARHGAIVENNGTVMNSTEYAATMLNTNNCEYLNIPFAESYNKLLYEFYCNTGILSNKIYYHNGRYSQP